MDHAIHVFSTQVDFFHSKNIRVILWATSMINTDSSNYQEAHDKEYLIRYVFVSYSFCTISYGSAV